MSTTFADQIDAFLSDATRRARLSQNTLRAYRYELSAAAKHFFAPLDQLTLADLETWVHRENAAPSTAGRRVAALNRFFVWAVRNHVCHMNPLVQRAPSRARRYLPRPIRSGDERRAIDSAIAAAPQSYRLMLTILRETGMRPSEVIGLNAGDVTLDAGREGLRVREPKNAVERMVVLGPEATPKSLRGLRAQLKTMKSQPPHVPLFRSNRGTRVSYDALHYQWAQVCAQAALVDAHDKPRIHCTSCDTHVAPN